MVKQKHNYRKLSAISVGVFFLLYACVQSSENQRAKELETQKLAADKAAAEQSKTQAFAAEYRAKMQVQADLRGMTYDDYTSTMKLLDTEVWMSCRREIESMAKWGADWDRGADDYTWVKKGDTIYLFGTDLKLKNGFNAEKRTTYRCEYNVPLAVLRVAALDGHEIRSQLKPGKNSW